MWGGRQVRTRASSPGLSINQEVGEADLGVGLRTRGPPYENSGVTSGRLAGSVEKRPDLLQAHLA